MFLDKIQFDLVMISPWLNHDLAIIQAWLELDLILILSQYDLGIFWIAWEGAERSWMVLLDTTDQKWDWLSDWLTDWLEYADLERPTPLKMSQGIEI